MADIIVNDQWATIICSDVKLEITLQDARGALTNYGSETVYLSMLKPAGALNRDGVQRNGEIELLSNSAMPIPPGTKRVQAQCAAGLTTKLWYVPTVK